MTVVYFVQIQHMPSVHSFGWVYPVYGIAIIVTRMLTGTLLGRPDRRDVLWPSVIMMAIGMPYFAYARAVWWLCLAANFTASRGEICHPALQSAGIGAVFVVAAVISVLAGVCQRWIPLSA